MARILVVEDATDVRENLVEMLSSEGYEVSSADSVATALRIVFAEKFDLIVSDIMMGNQDDGLALLQRVRLDKNTAATPVILLTARTARGDVRQGMNLGAQDYIPKPFTRAELLASVTARLKYSKDPKKSNNNSSDKVSYFVTVFSPACPSGEVIEIQDVCIFGRHKLCNICLPYKEVSRFHGTFQRKDKDPNIVGHYLVDGSIGKIPQPSEHGLIINGEKIDKIIELFGGEEIQVSSNISLKYTIKRPATDESTTETEL